MVKAAETPEQPLVSVVMATFNEPPLYVTQAIGSILNQTYRNIELLVLDDSTNPDTIQAIETITASDSRARVIRKKSKMGFVPALNIGLDEARGKYVARMDGDDISLPSRISTQVEYLEAHPEVDILGTCLNIMDCDGNVTSCRRYPEKGMRLAFYSALRTPVAHPSVMMRKNIQGRNRYDETHLAAEDLEMWMRLRKHGATLRNLRESLVNYRVLDEMTQKRDRRHFKFALKARASNISFKYFPFDILGVIMAMSYCIVPMSFISKIYSWENKLNSKARRTMKAMMR